MINFRKQLNFYLSIFISLASISLLQLTQIEKQKTSEVDLSENKTRLFLALQNNVPQFGFSNLKADLIYLEFIQYYGDTSIRQQTGYQLTPSFFELIVDNDPYFLDAFFLLSTANSLHAGQPMTTVKLLTKIGSKISPHISPKSPFIWSYKGIDEMLFLDQIQSAQKSFETAASWALETDNPAKDFIFQKNKATSAFLATNPDPTNIKIAAWQSILERTKTVKTRKFIINQIISLGGKVIHTPENGDRVYFPSKNDDNKNKKLKL